jgi:hypothetical protein
MLGHMPKETEVFEITSGNGRHKLATLKARPDVKVVEEKEYFGIGGSKDEGPCPMIYRTVDYETKEASGLLQSPVYNQPIA